LNQAAGAQQLEVARQRGAVHRQDGGEVGDGGGERPLDEDQEIELGGNGNYGDVMPRLLGVILLALGLIIVQIIRHHVEALYTTTLGVRVIIIVALVGLFIYSKDPLFISLTVVVGIGMILTGTSYLIDRRHLTT
jgi:hypothetical protein